MLEVSRIRAITLDLDDTLWPIWPTIARAEHVLGAWLQQHAPATATLLADAATRQRLRAQVERDHPHWAHDLSALRLESIRRGLIEAGDDPSLAPAAFDVFFSERQRVELFEDAVPALQRLSARLPVVALSNGNADLHRIGVQTYFHGAVSAREFGVAKPDPRIFHAAAQCAGVAPHEVLHIGDDIHLDAVGGLDAGLQVAWVNREGRDWPVDGRQPHLTVTDLLSLCERIL